jgi:hypothetical protein
MFASSVGFPYGQLLAVLSDSSFNATYQGFVQIDGHSVHDVLVQRVWPGQNADRDSYHTREFFLDTSTLQLVMTRDMVPRGLIRQVRYSDYKSLNGLVVPFSISQEIGGQKSWVVQISQMSFNTGLQDSDFEIQ